jgi:hypothetical protein
MTPPVPTNCHLEPGDNGLWGLMVDILIVKQNIFERRQLKLQAVRTCLETLRETGRSVDLDSHLIQNEQDMRFSARGHAALSSNSATKR